MQDVSYTRRGEVFHGGLVSLLRVVPRHLLREEAEGYHFHQLRREQSHARGVQLIQLDEWRGVCVDRGLCVHVHGAHALDHAAAQILHLGGAHRAFIFAGVQVLRISRFVLDELHAEVLRARLRIRSRKER